MFRGRKPYPAKASAAPQPGGAACLNKENRGGIHAASAYPFLAPATAATTVRDGQCVSRAQAELETTGRSCVASGRRASRTWSPAIRPRRHVGAQFGYVSGIHAWHVVGRRRVEPGQYSLEPGRDRVLIG